MISFHAANGMFWKAPFKRVQDVVKYEWEESDQHNRLLALKERMKEGINRKKFPKRING